MSASPASSTATDPKPTHCRTDGARNWMIYPASPSTLASDPGHNYQIHARYVRVPGQAIPIHEGDRFQLATHAGAFKLSHYKPQSGGAYALHATANLSGDASGVWMSGDATLASNDRVVGRYVVFKLADSGAMYSKNSGCQHPNGNPDDRCKAIHVEYYDTADGGSAGHWPVLEKNVIAIGAADPHAVCGGGPAQTEDGDGDHGPD